MECCSASEVSLFHHFFQTACTFLSHFLGTKLDYVVMQKRVPCVTTLVLGAYENKTIQIF